MPEPKDEVAEAYLALRRAYRDVFASPQGQAVLADLSRYCRKHKSTYVPGDPNGSASLEGRRQVILYVDAMCDESNALMRVLVEDDLRAQQLNKRNA